MIISSSYLYGELQLDFEFISSEKQGGLIHNYYYKVLCILQNNLIPNSSISKCSQRCFPYDNCIQMLMMSIL